MLSWRSINFAAVCLLAVISVYAWREMRSLRHQLEDSVKLNAQLQQQLALSEKKQLEEQINLKARLDNALSQLEQRQASPQAAPPPINPGRADDSVGQAAEGASKRADASERRLVWRARQGVSEVEEVMALSSAEKENLTAKLQQALQALPESATSGERDSVRMTTVSEVLGAERAEQYQRLKREAEQREFDESINRETIVLSRKLGLNQSQEQDVRNALIQAERIILPKRALVKEKMQEAMALHFEGQPGKEKLQTQYDEIKTLSDSLKQEKDRAIQQLLEGKLSEEQKNELLALQAQSP